MCECLHSRFWHNFGVRLKAARLAAGYSQRDMEMALHLGQHVMSKWERGYRHPRWPVLRRVCLMLKVGPETLFPDLTEWWYEDAALASKIALRDLCSVPDRSRRAEWSSAPVALGEV